MPSAPFAIARRQIRVHDDARRADTVGSGLGGPMFLGRPVDAAGAATSGGDATDHRALLHKWMLEVALLSVPGSLLLQFRLPVSEGHETRRLKRPDMDAAPRAGTRDT